MNGQAILTSQDFLRLLPLIIPAAGAMVALLIAGFRPNDRTWAPVVVAFSALLAIGAIGRYAWPESLDAPSRIGGMLAMDHYAGFFTFLVLAMLAGSTSLALVGLRARDYAHGEYWALLLFATCGMIILASAKNLLLVFIGVEVMSISVYALVGSDRARSRPPEAALKYFLLGAFSSAFLLFGIAFLYGATGSLDLDEIRRNIPQAHRPELMLGTAFLLVGFGFKTSVAPFHMWTPDAYTGAPSTVTAFMASGVKVASFAAFIRIFATTLAPNAGFWSDLVAFAAALTVIVGNLGAIAQIEVKRLLAYSGVAHAGYLLIGLRGVSLEPGAAAPAMLYYLLAYAFTALGSFAVVVAVERWRGHELKIDDLAGLSARRPLIAAAMSVFMLALAGVPPTAGFAAKFFVFGTVVKHGDYMLAVIGVLGSAVSLYYYLRVVVVMYMRDPDEKPAHEAADPGARMPAAYGTIAISVLIVLLAGIGPDWYLRLSSLAVASSFRDTMAMTQSDEPRDGSRSEVVKVRIDVP